MVNSQLFEWYWISPASPLGQQGQGESTDNTGEMQLVKSSVADGGIMAVDSPQFVIQLQY
jgi:hypothetical protein